MVRPSRHLLLLLRFWLTPTMLECVVLNICAMDMDQVTRFYQCCRLSVAQIVIKEFDSHIALFPGKTQAEVTRMLCNAVDDDGDLVYEDFMEAFTPEVRAEAEVVFARCAT
ncbi:uncharacterized protein LOC144178123 [Haemaphysalis longicornis]